jgi:hypothetical protein
MPPVVFGIGIRIAVRSQEVAKQSLDSGFVRVCSIRWTY